MFAGQHADDRGPLYGDDINEEFGLRKIVDNDPDSQTQGQSFVEVTFHFTNRDNEADTVVRTYPAVDVQRIVFNGGSGNDSLIVDDSEMPFDIPIRFTGGLGHTITF